MQLSYLPLTTLLPPCSQVASHVHGTSQSNLSGPLTGWPECDPARITIKILGYIEASL